MGDRTGTIVRVDPPNGKGPFRYTIKTQEDRELKVTAWTRIKEGDDWVDNPAANLSVGAFGTFQGESKEEEWDGKNFTRFYADAFTPATPSAVNGASPIANGNGSHSSHHHSGSSATPRTAKEITATEILTAAKDLVTHLIDIGAIKDLKEVDSAWTLLAEDGMTWHKQTTA